jgi:hypothetical protein
VPAPRQNAAHAVVISSRSSAGPSNEVGCGPHRRAEQYGYSPADGASVCGPLWEHAIRDRERPALRSTTSDDQRPSTPANRHHNAAPPLLAGFAVGIGYRFRLGGSLLPQED